MASLQPRSLLSQQKEPELWVFLRSFMQPDRGPEAPPHRAELGGFSPAVIYTLWAGETSQ